ncbi:MAG: DUF104 domain-containing protein [Candidatus Hydrogenedentes bacterium]|nr:DUF104 domain-containing protein [Candidatus Hydrogenedentota bacterium]
MLAIRGVYDGQVVRPLEPVNAPPNANVVVVFVEEQIAEKTRDVADLFGCLKHSNAFAGDGVEIQREMRGEWDD